MPAKPKKSKAKPTANKEKAVTSAKVAAKPPTAAPSPVTGPIKYTLKPAKNGMAKLSSPLLDRVMFPKGAVAMHPEKPSSPFQLASLEEFLRNQGSVRQAMEAGLVMRRTSADEHSTRGPHYGDDDVWQQVEVTQLELEESRVLTDAERAQLKADLKKATGINKHVLRHKLGFADTPDTRTRFKVHIRTAWDDEHPYAAEFRNGAMIEIGSW
jgi:hypothetical protein